MLYCALKVPRPPYNGNPVFREGADDPWHPPPPFSSWAGERCAPPPRYIRAGIIDCRCERHTRPTGQLRAHHRTTSGNVALPRSDGPGKGRNTCGRYHRSLMYIGLRTSDTLHKKPCCIVARGASCAVLAASAVTETSNSTGR
jgi:hypothetical protein